MTEEHENHDDGEMTDHEKEKSAFARHQDNLFWSRLPLVVSIQGATLAGTYAIQHDKLIVWVLAVVGCGFTGAILATMRRDDRLGEAAMKESRVPKTKLPRAEWARGWVPERFKEKGKERAEEFVTNSLKGKVIAYRAIVFLLAIDLLLPAILCLRSPVVPRPTRIEIVYPPVPAIPPASD